MFLYSKKVIHFILSLHIVFSPYSNLFAGNSTPANTITIPSAQSFDLTFTDEQNSSILINKTYIEVDKIIAEVQKITGALIPRDITIANCSATGCPIDAVQCDAVTELPSCPSGSVLNTTRDMCQKDPDVFECPSGFTYDNMLGKCVKPLECPSGGEYNVSRNRCEFKRIYECPVGYTQEGNTCVAPPTCPSSAIFNPTTLKCELDATYACADAGWTYEAATNKCWIAPPTCPSGYVYNTTYDKCFLTYTKGCPSGYTFNSSRDRCEKTPPDCPSGTTYNATTNRCEQGAGSACALSGGTWNGTDCTVSGSYVATIANVFTSCSYSGWGEQGGSIGGTLNIGESRLATSKDTLTCYADGTIIDRSSVTGGSYTISVGASVAVPHYNSRDIGTIRNSSTTTTTYTCPSGGTLSGTTCNTTSTVAPSCPVGYTHDGSGKCYANPTCPSSGSFDGNLDLCYVSFSKDCSSGTYDAPTDSCLVSYTPTCASGYTYNSTRDRCEKAPPDCPSGTTYNATTNRCEQGAGSACTLSGGTWNGTDCTVGGSYAATGMQAYTECLYQDCSYSSRGGRTTCGAVTSIPIGGAHSVGLLGTFTCQSNGSFTGTATVLPGDRYGNSNCAFLNCPIFANVSTTTTTYTCPSGGTLSGTTCNTNSNVAASCPVGYTNDNAGKCYANPTCPSSGSFDGTDDVCYLTYSKTCTDGIFDTTLNRCFNNATCIKGILNPSKDRCEQDYVPVCGTGWTFNSTTQFCEKLPVCITGTYSTTYDKCVLAYTPTCASGYTYNSSTSRCEKTPDCPNGTTYNVTTNRCEQGVGSACTLAGGAWNGTDCTVSGSYTATGIYTREPINGEYYDDGNGIITAKNLYFWKIRASDGYVSITWNGGISNSISTGLKNVTSWNDGIYTYYRGAYVKYYFGDRGAMDAIYHAIYRIKNTPDFYTCPSGGTLSGTTCNTTSNVAASCPIGYTHDGSGKCYANPTCPSSGSFDGTNDVCYLTFGKSCTSGLYDTTSNACILDPICDGGTLNTTLDKCQLSRDVVCSIGTKDLITGKCTFTASCQSNATLIVDKCTNYPIPLTCPSGTDTTLDVCYSNVNDCYVDSSYINANTLAYSTALKTCLVEEKIACATGLTWSEAYLKCEAVPICYNGMYNPENDFCYISTKLCPTNSSYPCIGAIGNKWCSPYNCNANTNQCGTAECPAAIMPSSIEMDQNFNAMLVYRASDLLCVDSRCDIANSSRFTYCGTEEACPSGFGVYEQNGKCWVMSCPASSYEDNSKCYTLGCPKGTIEQGGDKCLVN